MAVGSYEIGIQGSGAISHAYIEYPPFRCDIPGALGVTYDDANKLLVVPTLGEIYSWSVSSYPSSDPLVIRISQGPVLGVRFSLDRKILAVQRSNTEIEFINREDCTTFTQACKNVTERILGFFWTDCPDCDIVFVTASGLELYSLYLGRNRLKLIEKKRQAVSWFVYTHESRLVLLASGMQCKTLSGYQFSAGGIVRLPKFDAVMTKSDFQRSPVLASENVYIVTMYGRLYCLQVDPVAKLLRMYRFYRDAVISQRSVPTYTSHVAVSVVDNVLLVHQIDSKVVLLYDILSESKAPVSAPLPLLLRQNKLSKDSQRKLAAEEASLYGEGWVFVNPDVILDHTHGLLWKIHLDLEAVAASSSDVPSLLAFLQRRRLEAMKAKQLSLSILRSLIMEKRSYSVISAALDVITSASGHAKRLSNTVRPALVANTGRFPSMSLISTPGLQPTAISTALALGTTEISNGALQVHANGGQMDSESGESSSTRLLDSENQTNSPVISPAEMYENVFAVVDEGLAVESGFLVAVMVEYMRRAMAEQLVLPPDLHILLVRLLARDKCFVKIHQLVVDKVLEPSKPLALQLLEIGSEQCPGFKELGMDMLRRVPAHKEYVNLLLEEGRILEGLRYIRQNKVEAGCCVLFLEVAAAQQHENSELFTSMLRFCCDFVPSFEQSPEFEKFYTIVKRNASPTRTRTSI